MLSSPSLWAIPTAFCTFGFSTRWPGAEEISVHNCSLEVYNARLLIRLSQGRLLGNHVCSDIHGLCNENLTIDQTFLSGCEHCFADILFKLIGSGLCEYVPSAALNQGHD
mmetsp:Transcript_87319/g.121153  ORF Transcript_87319/g.121153 Transcript_87319/m.121153 type:complete len:110 (-) Transcript_87319:60-389(-)